MYDLLSCLKKKALLVYRIVTGTGLEFFRYFYLNPFIDYFEVIVQVNTPVGTGRKLNVEFTSCVYGDLSHQCFELYIKLKHCWQIV